MEAAPEHTPKVQRPPRDVFLQRPSPFSPFAAPFRFYWRNLLSTWQHILVISLIFLMVVPIQMTLIPRTYDWAGLCLVAAALAGAWWYFGFHCSKQRQNRELVEAIEKASGVLHDIAFDNGSVDDFNPAGVLWTTDDIVIAIDPERGLIRAISTSRRIDRIFELPVNADLNIGPHAQPGQPHKQVLSLIFSDEQEDGFKITAWPLAPDSVETAQKLVAELRARRGA